MGRKMDVKLVEHGASVMQPDGARRISDRARKVSKIRSLFLARCVISFITRFGGRGVLVSKQFGGMWGASAPTSARGFYSTYILPQHPLCVRG